MAKNPPEGFARVTPYLYYEDVGAALDWLAEAFGFEEKVRMKNDEGVINHAEMSYEGQSFMLGQPGPEYKSPKSTGSREALFHVYVDDVDAHHRQAKEAGANIVQEPTDQFYGDREYGAEDLEGHHWYFATHVKDPGPDELKPS